MMGETTEIIEEPESIKNKKIATLAIGGVIGALIGIAGAYLIWRNAESSGGEIEISAGEGISLSLLVMGLLRQVAKIGE
jgi:hypothetical protein